MQKTISLSILVLCAFPIHAADTREDIIRKSNDQQRQMAQDIVSQFTEEQKQEAFICMLMSIDASYIPNIDQATLKKTTHPEGPIAQALRPIHLNMYQIMTAEGLDDADRVAAYASFNLSNIYNSVNILAKQETPDKEKHDSIMLYALSELFDSASTEDFNHDSIMHIQRVRTIYRISKEHNVLPITEEKFNELFNNNTQWSPPGQNKNCAAIQLLTQALNEQQENTKDENSLLPAYKQAFTETLEGFMQIHSPQ